MKFLLLLITTAFSVTSFATSLHPDTYNRFYSPEFRIHSIEPVCPLSIPTGAQCMGVGQIVVLKATLNGCLDKLSNFNTSIQTIHDTASISIDSRAVSSPGNKPVLCRFLPVVTKRVVIPENSVQHFKLIQTIYDNESPVVTEKMFTKYSVDFKVISFSPICNNEKNLSVTCMSTNSKLVIRAKLDGCLDTIVRFDSSQYFQGSKLYLRVNMVALSHPDNDRVRCLKIPEVTRNLIVPVNNVGDLIIHSTRL